ncbi:hypothetical protein CGMCC3_g6472 [Colletotrichum fructicola]|nr:uncharacterized protein CGMCC3_g6472 [Colletotrichum fructicola]KAE9577315.1 hypothetical protein CGMCC3_g6472 [Colletotrichum fructicola]KAK1844861.1 phosphoprotein phosphatase [Colletotrichum chrysophilum]
MRPSILNVYPRSFRLAFRQPYATLGTTRKVLARQRSCHDARDPQFGGRVPSYPDAQPLHPFKVYAMDMPNMQWWAKPAPTITGAPAQTPGGSFTIPGLGNNTQNGSFPFPQAAPASQAAPGGASQQPTPPKGPRAKAMNDRDKIVAPSLASGGVPDPTAEYLQRASIPPTLLPTPKPILVVMDLNGTLLYRPNRRNATSFVERPYAKRFLQYCLDTFHVVIWSSARPQNVQSMCDQLLLGPPIPGGRDRGEIHRRVLAIWGRDRFGLSKADYNLRVQVYKRLQKVWDDPRVKSSHPDAEYGGCWDQSNTVLIDDSLEKARSEPYNLLRIPEFFGNDAEPGLVVPQVHDYLNSLCYQSDVSSYMRTNPFQMKEDYKLEPPEEK